MSLAHMARKSEKWIMLPSGFMDWPKTISLVRATRDPMAWGRVVNLWLWCAANRPTGVIGRVSDRQIARRSGSRARSFANALRVAGFIEGHENRVVDWGDIFQREHWSKRNYPYVKIRDRGRCRYCDQPGTTIDHVYPRRLGGGDESDNLVVACWPCNSRKRGRTPDMASMPLLSEAH